MNLLGMGVKGYKLWAAAAKPGVRKIWGERAHVQSGARSRRKHPVRRRRRW